MTTRVYDKASVFRKEDDRLEKKISVDRPRVYAGELMEILAQQTGVSIEASDTDGAASEELVAVLKDMPLADAMECLTSLLSHKNARWQWRREGNGKDKPYVYRLLRPENAIALYAEKAKAQIQADFEGEAEVMVAGLDMSPEDLKSKAKDNPRLNFLSDKATSLGIHSFRDSLTPEQRLSILRKENSGGVTIPLNKLDASGQQLEAFMYSRFQSLNPDTKFNIDSAQFYISETEFPRLVIQFGELGGWTYLGGKTLQDKFIKREGENWLQDNETLADADLESQTLPKPKDREKTPKMAGSNEMPGWLSYMGEAGSFSVLARLERDSSTSASGEPWQKTVGEFLKDKKTGFNLLQKWHKTTDDKSILIIDYMGWFKQDTNPKHPRLPWNIVKQFRQAQMTGTNESLLHAMLTTSAGLNPDPDQIRLAIVEFPIAQWIHSRYFWLQPLARFIQAKPNRYNQLLSPQGMQFKAMPDDLRLALINADGTPNEKKMTATSGSARLVLLPDSEAINSFRLEVLDDKGNMLTMVSAPNWKAGNVRTLH